MLGVEWPSEVVENFSQKEEESDTRLNLLGKPLSKGRNAMFHTIDLVGSSDEDFDDESQISNDFKTVDKIRNSSQKSHTVNDEVEEVVRNIVDFVERSLLFPEFGHDPQAAVKAELMEKKEGVICNKPHCRGGCLCSSLKGYFPHGPTHPTHCGKEICMFDCYCFERACGIAGYDDENRYSDKSKRKKKLPTRFKDVVLGKAYEKLHARTILEKPVVRQYNSSSDSDESKTSSSEKNKGGSDSGSCPNSKVPSPEQNSKESSQLLNKPSNKKSENVWSSSDKIASIRKTMHERRVGFVANTLNDEQTLADVFIWCSQHNKYSCLCINYVFFSKTNALLWRPSRQARYLANKVMFDIALKQPTQVAYEVFPYDLNKYSARTIGSIIDYGARNKDDVFISKRKLEMDNNVMSYSNSYVKFKKFLVLKRPSPVCRAEPFDREDPNKLSWGQTVRLIKTGEKSRIVIDDESMDCVVSDEDGKSDESTSPASKASTPGRKRRLTMKMMQLEEEKKREKDIDELEESAVSSQEVDEPVVTRSEKIEKQRRSRKTKWAIMERRSSEPAHVNSFREPTPDIELIACSKPVEPTQNVDGDIKDDFVEESPVKKEDEYLSKTDTTSETIPKEEDIICAPDIREMVNCGLDSSDDKKALSDGDTHNVSPKIEIDSPKLSSGSEGDVDFAGFEDRDGCADSDEIDSIHSSKILILEPRPDGYPHLGLLCLTPGIGFLNVIESLPGRLVVQDPIDPSRRHTFDNLLAVNGWLNAFFKCRLPFSPPDLTLKWILVRPALLKLKQVKPFEPKILRNPSLIVSHQGLKRRVIMKSRKTTYKTGNCSILKCKNGTGGGPSSRQLNSRSAASIDTLGTPRNGSNFVPNPKFYASKMNSARTESVLLKMSRLKPLEISSRRTKSLPVTPRRSNSHPIDSFIADDSRTAFAPKYPSFLPQSDLSIQPDVTIRPLPNLTKTPCNLRNCTKTTVKETIPI